MQNITTTKNQSSMSGNKLSDDNLPAEVSEILRRNSAVAPPNFGANFAKKFAEQRGNSALALRWRDLAAERWEIFQLDWRRRFGLNFIGSVAGVAAVLALVAVLSLWLAKSSNPASAKQLADNSAKNQTQQMPAALDNASLLRDRGVLVIEHAPNSNRVPVLRVSNQKGYYQPAVLEY